MKLGIYEYDFEESWVEENNIQPSDVGVLAQELSQVIPTAVRKVKASLILAELTFHAERNVSRSL